ncbi:SpvB/TcaC N-terminal domain-containing protein [Chryseobacterium sp. DT-3]|uniref:SpvB/TcaC N-terminal domain-containing protein n=1 Tax=Chryseobacterium sp. DT-3 TaxID=3396164 RepID=UPI003F1B0CAD
MEINDASKNNIKKDVSERIKAEEKKENSKEPDGISGNTINGSKEKSGHTILVPPVKTVRYNASAPLSLNEKRYYISDIKEGIIGTSSEHPIDQIYDNIFNISVDEKINSTYQYTLEYDLYGVDSYKEVSKVINDDLAVGGKNIQKNTTWIHQSEPIADQSIQQGKNTVIFTLPYLADYSYKVKNLRIGISNKKQNFKNSIGVKYNALSVSKFVGSISDSEKLNLGSAELNIPKGVLKSSENFSITALRDIDMPAITPEMVNVTSESAGYRFLPHGDHFSAPAKVSLGYDKSKIPTGYTEQDIKTFYFDRTEKKWIALDKDSVNLQQNILVSKTTHFTDMVNGVLKVPESPETGSYAPNSIKDIKAANPSEGIVSIAPPSPNSMGSVTTNFPIKLPAGRAGMQPSLAVSYSSEGGNGWMGLGWDMSVPSVNIDTRWGVPTYNQATETELYSIGGEQLTFETSPGIFAMPNRNEGFEKGRIPHRKFYPRIEGAYNNIVRRGTSPKNYFWIVTSKDGTKSFFGGEAGVIDNAVLKDANGNIGHWALYKTVDTNGNYVLYTYDKSTYTGNPGNGGQELHISQIDYTLHNAQNPVKKYTVLFTTTTGREDVQINGRLGFLQIESKRLSKVEIKYGDENVRSYEFGYKNDDKTFRKSLLKNITEKDAAGAVFYTNEIEYNEAPDGANMFGAPQPWAAPDPASFPGLLSSGQLFQGYTMLSGSQGKSTGTNFGISVGVYNFSSPPTSDTGLFSFRQGTVGAHGSISNSSSENKITLIDIDGDNLADRVYQNNGVISYSKNLSTATNGVQAFGPQVSVGNLQDIGKSKNSSWGVGIDANFGGGSLGFDYSNSTNTTASYFMDFNNDGLVDFVKNGKVYFNSLIGNIPSFDPNSGLTPYPINVTSSGAQPSVSLFDDQDKTEKKMMLEQNPLHDVVRVWVAPKSGSITVKNAFKLNQVSCNPEEDCSKADGVAVSFQYKNNDPLVNNINAGDYNLHSFADQIINISKGEKLYFRVSSKYDGTLDQLTWNPEITYSTPNIPAVDSDNRDLSTYKAQEDFVNSGTSAFMVGNAGTLNLYLNKIIPLSDDAKIFLTVNDVDYPQFPMTIASGSTYNNSVIGSQVNLNPNDKVSVKVYTDTQIDWSNFKLIPEFTETSTGEKTYLQVEYSMYNDRGNFVTYATQSADIGKKISVKASSLPNFNGKSGKVVISAKIKNKLLTKTVYNVVNGNVTPVFGTPYTIVSQDLNENIYLETTVSSEDRDFINNITSITGTLINNGLNYIDNPNNLSVQLSGSNTVQQTGTIVINQATMLKFELGNYVAGTSATLGINTFFPNGTLSGQSGMPVYSETMLNPGTYSYTLTFSPGGAPSAFTKLYIENPGSETIITSFTNSPPHKPILGPQTPTSALSSNEYDNRFGILYRGWGGFILNGNNLSKNTIVEAYDINNNLANGGTDAEMKVDETRLKLSNAYGIDQGINPTINNPIIDPDGNITIADNDGALSKNYFLMINSNVNNTDKGRLTDVDPTIYISQNTINTSRLGIHNIDSNFDNHSLSQAVGSELNAPNIQLKNQSVSIGAGVSAGVAGVNVSQTLFSEAKSVRNVLDYNGDGFPDDFSKTNVKITYPVGFLSGNSLNVGSQSISKASSTGISSGYSFVHGESTRMAFIQTAGKNPKNKSFNENLIDSSVKSKQAATKLSISANGETSSENSKQTFLDINGDGLPDKFNTNNFELNIGNGFAGNDSWGSDIKPEGVGNGFGLGGGISLFRGSFEFGVNFSSNTSTTTKELVDINGDGLADKVLYTGNSATVYLNLGDRMSSTPLNLNFQNGNDIHKDVSISVGGNAAGTILISIPIIAGVSGLKLNVTLGVSKGNSTSRSHATFRDMNGDGYPDLVTSDDTDNIKVQLNQTGVTNLLKKVTTPMGGSWEVTYERLGNTYDMPQSKYVLKSVITNDGFTGDNAYSPDVSKVTVEYQNPYHSRRERTFYGFGGVTINQIDTKQGGAGSNVVYRKTLQTFNNTNYYLKGTLISEVLYDANNKVWTTKFNQYSLRLIKNTGYDEFPLEKEDEKLGGNYAYFVSTDISTSYFYEGQMTPGKSTSTTIVAYDQWGNATGIVDIGDQEIGVTTDGISSVLQYSNVDPSGYVIMPVSVKNTTITGNGFTREKKAEYSANGNLSKMTILNQGVNYSVYDFEYDVYGNITKSTGPANVQNQRFFQQYTYDDNVKTYPVKVQDAFGYSSKTQYDFRFGVPTYTEDMNLQPMKYVYDAKARTTEITGPYELFNNIPWTIKFEYNPITDAPLNATNAQSFATTKHYDPEYTDSTINTITIADGFGGAVQVKKTGDIHNQGLKYIVSGKVEEDAFGRALKTYYPTVEDIGSSNTQYNAVVDNIEPTINQYDVLDRVIYTKLPGENLFSTITYGFGTDVQGRNMFETIFKDELGSIKKTYTDIKGRTTSVHEVSNTGDIKTQFTHDAIGEILQVKDVNGNITTSVYDDLGRRVSYTHPDSGVTTYKYDPASNMTSKTNAANETVEYQYDYSRLKEVKYPLYPENNVKYYYGNALDASAMDNNAVGRLWYQTDATGTQYLKYGRLGELTYQRRSVAVPGAQVYWFGTEWQYDTWNRVKTITYPDGEKLTYKYNRAGNLNNVASVKDGNSYPMINSLGYDKFEQRVYLKNGNGTETTYEYETNRRRLLKMYAQNTNTNRFFMQNVYQYDVVSNVMQVHNNAPVVNGLLGGGTNYAYGYDDLYRLTSASGNWRGINTQAQEERHRYTVAMSYDNMHNIMSKTQKHEWTTGASNNNWTAMEPTSYRLNYKYENSSHPHAPTTIVDEPNLVPSSTCCNPDDPGVKFQHYKYDAKGNPTTIEQETCTYAEAKAVYQWDEENRLRFVDTNPSTPEVDGAAIYTYDAGGERIIKDVMYSGMLFRTRAEQTNTWPQTPMTYHSATIYPNGLLTMNLYFDSLGGVSLPRYTKHYYAGSQRIVTKNGTSDNIGVFDCNWLIIPFAGSTPPINPVNTSNTILQAATQATLAVMQQNNITPPPNYGQNAGYNGACVNDYAGDKEKEIYWFHPDHLGSSSFITGADGEVTQNIEYFPSGETFVENHRNSNYSPYKFNGKELDAETGYYYYGARYYNPRVSLWLNVDPLAEQTMEPYIYCGNHPINYIDPDGNFRLPANATREQKRLYKEAIKTIKAVFRDSEFRGAFKEKFGVDDKMIQTMLKDGDGPTVIMNESLLDLGNFDQDDPNVIKIDSGVVNTVSKNKGNKKYIDNLAEIIIHEGGHWADYAIDHVSKEKDPLFKKSLKSKGVKGDIGDNWEIIYFGTDLQFSASDRDIISEKFDGFRRNNAAKDFRQQREIRDLKSEKKPSILDIYKKPKDNLRTGNR